MTLPATCQQVLFVVLLVGGLALSGAGCGGGSCDEASEVADAAESSTLPTYAPDFTLTDVNPNSATAGRGVGPRQFVSRISAWYFGVAT